MFALRGAISVDRDEAALIESAAAEIIRELLARNALTPAQVLSAFFTSTPDLTAAFPAAGARRVGFGSVPMLCASEIAVPGAPVRIVRVMLHVNGEATTPPRHAYLGAAAALRPDLADSSANSDV